MMQLYARAEKIEYLPTSSTEEEKFSEQCRGTTSYRLFSYAQLHFFTNSLLKVSSDISFFLTEQKNNNSLKKKSKYRK